MAFDVEGARKAGYSDAEIAAHLSQEQGFDLAGAKKSKYSDSEVIAHLASAAALPAPRPGIGARVAALPGQIAEAVTGAQRATPETQELPDWAGMPELNSFSLASAKTGLGTLLSNPQETVQIIKANFPGVEARQDEKGNFLLRSSIDGQEYAIKPGFAVSDVPRAAGAVAAFTPAGRATSILGAGLASAGTQVLIEGSQAATGGNFNTGEVAAAGAFGAAVPAVVNGVRALAKPVRQLTARVRGIPEPAATAVPPPGSVGSPAAAAVPDNVPAVQAAPVAPAAPALPALSPDELGQTMRKASIGGLGGKRSQQILAQQVMPDAETVAAAERLGIAEHLQPDHVTTNQAYRQLAQLVKSQTGSEAAVLQRTGLEKVAERANGLIDEIGGTADASTLSSTVRARMEGTQKELEAIADDLYGQVRAQVPANTPAPATNVLEFIEKREGELGGKQNLSPMEKRVLGKLSPKAVQSAETVPGNPLMPGSMRETTRKATSQREPTYTLLDDVRKDLGAAARMSGPFKDADTGLAKKLYGLLSDDQAAAIGQSGASEIYTAARQSVAVRKSLEDDMVAIFGKQLDRSMAPLVSGSIKKLGQGDTAAFAKLIAAVPKDMRQQVTASGLSSFFQRTARGGEMDFAGYAKWFDALQTNKQAMAALMGNLPPGSAKQLADLARVSRGISMAKGEFITTGKAINPKVLEAADTMTRRIYEEVARRGVAGIVAEGVGTASGAPGLASALMSATMKNKPSIVQAADKLITSPEFVASVRAQGTPAAASAVTRLSVSKPFTTFYRAVGAPREMSNRERWILNAMQTQNTMNRDSDARN